MVTCGPDAAENGGVYDPRPLQIHSSRTGLRQDTVKNDVIRLMNPEKTMGGFAVVSAGPLKNIF